MNIVIKVKFYSGNTSNFPGAECRYQVNTTAVNSVCVNLLGSCMQLEWINLPSGFSLVKDYAYDFLNKISLELS